MAERLRIGMIGAGWVTQYHLPGWAAEASRAEVVAICDPDPGAAQARARAFGIPRVHADAAAMVAAGGLDALDICAPRGVHAQMVRLAAGAGLAAICQKPLAPTLAEAEALVAEVGATIPLMVHENWRFRPWYRALKGWIEAGRLGEIRQVHLDVLSSGMIPGPDGLRPAVVRQPFLTGLDRMLVAEMLIHQIDTLRYLLGEMRPASARLWQSTPALKGEDIASVALQRPDGVPVTITANLAVPGAPPLPADRLRIIGSRAVARLDGARLTLTGPEPEDRGFDADAGYRGSYAATIAHFLDHLEDRRFETAPADNLRTLALVEAIYSGDNRPPAPGGGADDR